MPPRISIIIPHFERESLLRETLCSLRDQSIADWEAWIVDDGSSSESWEAVQQLADRQRIHATQRKVREKGPSACRNLGAELASGEWLLFLDSDDLMAPWCLEQRLAEIERNPEDFVVFPVALFQQHIGDLPEMWNALAGEDDLRRFLISDAPWQTSSPLWRRSAFLKFGGFNERIIYGDDSDCHARALLAGLRYRKVETALPDVFIRRSGSARITNQSADRMVNNRRQRLIEGMRHLQQSDAPLYALAAFEGQFFVEAEFLLFNLPEPDQAVRETLALMDAECSLGGKERVVTRAYFNIALRCKAKAYIVLRLARRIAQKLLPRDYFPELTPSEQRKISDDDLRQIKARMASTVTTTPPSPH